MHALSIALAVMFPGNEAERSLPTIRLVDFDLDGRLDQLRTGADGSVSVAMNQGGRHFEPTGQVLPSIVVSHVLADDLNGDGSLDLYLVSPQANAALLGDGTGRFYDATSDLGLADAGEGMSAGRADIDGDGVLDLLLHNRGGDVIFWGIEGGVFERDPATPELPAVTLAAPSGGRVGEAIPAVPGAGSSDGARAPAERGKDAREGGSAARMLGTSPGGPGTRSIPVRSVDPIPAPAVEPLFLACAPRIRDFTTGNCILADTTPTLGRILPQSSRLFVTPGGDVGVGTVAPAEDLHVIGETRADAHFIEGATDAVHRGLAGRFGQAPLFNFANFTEGAMIEGGTSESGGFFANGDVAVIWSPGDPDILRVYDEDTFGGTPTERFTIDGAGNLEQQLGNAGLAKAGCQVDASDGTPAITRQFNQLPVESITIVDLGVGIYEVDFGNDLTGRFYQGTLGNSSSGTPLDGSISVTPRAGNANAVFVNTYDLTGASIDNNFYLLIY